jgi:hypothetical protein
MWSVCEIRSKEVLIFVNGPKDLAIDTNDASRDGPRRTTSYVGNEQQGEAFARLRAEELKRSNRFRQIPC